MSEVNSFDPSGACLVLAPHLQYPARNGADITIDKMWPAFSRFVPYVDVIGKTTIRRYVNGISVHETQYPNPPISRSTAALRTLIKRSHYLLETNLTPTYRLTARRYLARSEYRTIVLSYLSTTALLKAFDFDGRLVCVETHNDELKFYRQLASASGNPLRSMVARASVAWLTSLLTSDLRCKLLFLHVSEADRNGYLEVAPDHKSQIMPIGVDQHLININQYPERTEIKEVQLLFIGSLSVQQNIDALRWFAARFYPALKDALEPGASLTVNVAGSNPNRGVTSLCQALGWILHSDVSEQELKALYRSSTFSLLPFPKSAGVKLKLLETLAAGVPCLAGEALSGEVADLPYPCLISDNPREWVDHVLLVKANGITREERLALAACTQTRSWEAMAQALFQALRRNEWTHA